MTSSFDDLALDPRLLEVVAAQGYERPTPIQAQAIPVLLEGHDVVGRARTGSGKTAAYGLPLLHGVRDGAKSVRALVLTPTRELAIQVTEALRTYAKRLPVKIVTIYGGAAYPPQLQALRQGVPVVVGTPGRLIDHLERGSLDLTELQTLVIDEADEMLRMGFIDEVEKILAASPPTRQTMLFSATMPPPIRRIAGAYLREPKTVQVESEALTTAHIQQRWLEVPQRHKLEGLLRILASEEREGTLVFARTKAGCAEVARELAERGLSVDALHGDLSQSARELVLTRLRARRLDVLIATDVAARGLDVEHLSHVINLDLPNDAESYVHRIGRTGRAGRVGMAITLVTPRETGRLRALSRALGVPIEPIQAPSDAQIRERSLARLAGQITGGMDSPGPEALRGLAEKLLEQHEPAALLASALQVLASVEGLHFEGHADERPPFWSRPRASPPKATGPKTTGPKAQRERVPAGDESVLFLPTGEVRGLRIKDLVGALTNEIGVPIGAIGRITIEPHKTFFRVPHDVAERLLAEHPTLSLRGRDVPLSRARPQRPAPWKGKHGGKGGRGAGAPHLKKKRSDKRGNR